MTPAPTCSSLVANCDTVRWRRVSMSSTKFYRFYKVLMTVLRKPFDQRAVHTDVCCMQHCIDLRAARVDVVCGRLPCMRKSHSACMRARELGPPQREIRERLPPFSTAQLRR